MQIELTIHLEGTNKEVADSVQYLLKGAKWTPAYKQSHFKPGKARLRAVTQAGGWDAWCKKWIGKAKSITCEVCNPEEEE